MAEIFAKLFLITRRYQYGSSHLFIQFFSGASQTQTLEMVQWDPELLVGELTIGNKTKYMKPKWWNASALYALLLANIPELWRIAASSHVWCALLHIRLVPSFTANMPKHGSPNVANASIPKRHTAWHEAIPILSGAGAGVVCAVLCAPLDVAKIRMQVQGMRCGMSMVFITQLHESRTSQLNLMWIMRLSSW